MRRTDRDRLRVGGRRFVLRRKMLRVKLRGGPATDIRRLEESRLVHDYLSWRKGHWRWTSARLGVVTLIVFLRSGGRWRGAGVWSLFPPRGRRRRRRRFVSMIRFLAASAATPARFRPRSTTLAITTPAATISGGSGRVAAPLSPTPSDLSPKSGGIFGTTYIVGENDRARFSELPRVRVSENHRSSTEKKVSLPRGSPVFLAIFWTNFLVDREGLRDLHGTGENNNKTDEKMGTA